MLVEDDDFFPEDEAFSLVPGNKFLFTYTSNILRIPGPQNKVKKGRTTKRRKLRGSQLEKRKNNALTVKWSDNELRSLLENYIEFHFVMVFDKNAEERYRKEEDEHPYFKAFKEVNDLNHHLITQIRKLFHLDAATVLAITRHSTTWEHRLMWQKYPTEEEKIARENRSSCCLCPRFLDMYEIHFLGHPYSRNSLDEQIIEEGRPEQESFVYCNIHREAVSFYFALYHMRWNIYRNCENQIRLRQDENAKLSSTELIEAVNPKLIRNLTKWYIHYYRSIEKLFRWID